MVAHLGCVAMVLSHNFSQPAKGCTKHGERAHTSSQDCSMGRKKSRMIASLSASKRRMQTAACVSSSSCLDEDAPPRVTGPIVGLRRPRWIQTPTFDILNTCRQGQDFPRETGAHSYAQAHISTQPAPSLENAWLPLTHEDEIGSRSAQPPSCRRTQARLSQCRLPRLTSSPPPSFGRSSPQRFWPKPFQFCHERNRKAAAGLRRVQVR
jgi:hypothetical protein